jgi:hypothetical protein
LNPDNGKLAWYFSMRLANHSIWMRIRARSVDIDDQKVSLSAVRQEFFEAGSSTGSISVARKW